MSGDGFLAPYKKLTQHEEFHSRYLLLVHPEHSLSGDLSTCADQIKRHSDLCKGPSSRFVSGWAGVIDYPAHPSHQPQCRFHYFPYSILIDPDADYCLIQSYTALPDVTLATLRSEFQDNTPSQQAYPTHQRDWQPGWRYRDYHERFQKVHNYLLEGDCYQINLTMPFFCRDDLRNQPPFPLLDAFRAPFSFYMKTPERTVFSVTPERLLRVCGNQIETRPIKGTAPRSADPIQDQALADDLINSEKNRAENLMIVDLLRNDLSRCADPDSVIVDTLCALESHTNVHHLVSTISATLREGLTATDVIKTVFPGGSITGAPKQRAMEIINELEIQPRQAYCGSAGFFDDGGHADFNILIRTITATEEQAVCWGGGGIVIDSTAEDEYQEIFNKVQKILNTPL